MIGHQQARAVAAGAPDMTARQAEFRVFSQWNEDGIVQWLIAQLGLADGRFIEFGVESYEESNTRFLLQHNNWRGLVLDAGEDHVGFIRASGLMWQHDITAARAFVDRDNVNGIFEMHGFAGDIELLSIDIDGNDYGVWEAIDVVRPKIVIIEYNSTFGPELAVTVPYDAGFDVSQAHPSHLYFGASLAALADLGVRKGYALVATESHGANAFFVRDDVMGPLSPLSAVDAWVESRFRSSRDASGELTYVADHRERLRLIRDLPLVDVRGGDTSSIAHLYAV